MRCHICGSELKNVITDLPFKLGNQTIVILKGLLVKQCVGCHEYLLDDSVTKRVEAILERVDITTELEVIKYAA